MKKLTYYILYTLVVLLSAVWVSFTDIPEVIAERLSRSKIVQYVTVFSFLIVLFLIVGLLFLLYESIHFFVNHWLRI